ncbi:HD domain protein [bacterium BMS3Abin03]|nr:HD domain protein [bacterium BMS3Abin03]
MSEELIKKAENYVRELFKEKTPPENVYHNLVHTSEVVSAAREIADAEGVNDDKLELLLIAAWFHDTGYVQICKNHEDISIVFAKEYLNSINYPEEKIKIIVSLIEATQLPQTPKDHLEEIICDADLKHLGSDDFETKGDLFRLELEKKKLVVCTDEEWVKTTIDFFKQHHYFTKYAKDKFRIQKKINVAKLEIKLKELHKKKKKMKQEESKQGNSKQKTNGKNKQETKAVRGIETMFRNTIRTHVAFSEMADKKANIMISVNTLVLTIIVSVLIRKLDTNPQLVIPTALLTITCLVALVYAIIVTRPNITSGTFSKQDIKEKKANLLFFGNFYNMKLDDFSWGMREMMNDRDYLYDSMIKDFYHLGQVLGLKYRQLRICYTFFMYGIIISIIAYAIAFILYPQGANLGPILD